MEQKLECPSKESMEKVVDLYFFKFRLLPSEEQNKYNWWDWITEHWNDYSDDYPYYKNIDK